MKRAMFALILAALNTPSDAMETPECPQLRSMYLRMNAFTGGDYFPDRTRRPLVYADRYYLDVGWEYDITDNTRFSFALAQEDNIVDRNVLLERGNLSYHTDNFWLAYKLEKTAYGNGS